MLRKSYYYKTKQNYETSSFCAFYSLIGIVVLLLIAIVIEHGL